MTTSLVVLQLFRDREFYQRWLVPDSKVTGDPVGSIQTVSGGITLVRSWVRLSPSAWTSARSTHFSLHPVRFHSLCIDPKRESQTFTSRGVHLCIIQSINSEHQTWAIYGQTLISLWHKIGNQGRPQWAIMYCLWSPMVICCWCLLSSYIRPSWIPLWRCSIYMIPHDCPGIN